MTEVTAIFLFATAVGLLLVVRHELRVAQLLDDLERRTRPLVAPPRRPPGPSLADDAGQTAWKMK